MESKKEDKTLNDRDRILASLAVEDIKNILNFKALKELLIDKEIITQNEFESKFKEVVEKEKEEKQIQNQAVARIKGNQNKE